MDGTKDLEKKVLEFKNALEKIPELAWNEHKTQEFVISSLGSEYLWKRETGVVYSVGHGKPIFFRAELDALNTQKGPVHACGHSAHIAALMGAYLYFKRNSPRYKIYFIFQPSEEGFPSGARFITRHFLRTHPTKAGFGFHVWDSLPKGKLFDVQLASGDYFEIELFGSPTHIKNKNIYFKDDVLIVAAKLISNINKKKFKHIIINVGTVQGGEAPNSIAGYAKLKGDIRTDSDSLRGYAYEWLREQLVLIKKDFPTIGSKIHYSKVYPVLKNDQHILRKINKIMPISGRVESFGTEDFSLYPKPFVFLLMGTGLKVGIHELEFLLPSEVVRLLFTSWIRLGAKLDLQQSPEKN